jgi:hypothetical protein
LLSFAAEVKHALGMPYRKVCRILESGFGIIEFRDIITEILRQASPKAISLLEYAGLADQQTPPLPP